MIGINLFIYVDRARDSGGGIKALAFCVEYQVIHKLPDGGRLKLGAR